MIHNITSMVLSLTLSDFHSVGVSGPLQSVGRLWKDITNSFQNSIFRTIKFGVGEGGSKLFARNGKKIFLIQQKMGRGFKTIVGKLLCKQ